MVCACLGHDIIDGATNSELYLKVLISVASELLRFRLYFSYMLK